VALLVLATVAELEDPATAPLLKLACDVDACDGSA
jgi:hypothetical protein